MDVVTVDGRGMPAPGVHAIESSAAEVEAVVALVRAHYESTPEQSLAVIALNHRHGDRLRAAVAEAANDPGLPIGADSRAFMEPFVIVDAEDARDVRRDHVIISVGFARTPHGRVIHDFGAYSQPGGEELLAQVLRCVRQDLTVVSSIVPADIAPDRLRYDGARMLIDLVCLGDGSDDETPAGEDAWPTLEAAPDHLLVDLAERLYGLGLNVVPNLGVPGGMRIPLGIGHPEVPGELLVAILTDDEDYISEPSLRVRDWLRPRLLEEQGWKVRTELSMAVFIDPNREAEAIVQLVLDAVDEYYERFPERRPGNPVDEASVPSDSEDPSAEDQGASEDNEPGGGEDAGHSPDPVDADSEPEEDSSRSEEPAVTSIPPVPESAAATNKAGGVVPRPPIAVGLPLAAYGDDQLDEVAQWIMSNNPDLTPTEAVEEMRNALQLTRRGAQSDAVLRHVIKRNRPDRPGRA